MATFTPSRYTGSQPIDAESRGAARAFRRSLMSADKPVNAFCGLRAAAKHLRVIARSAHNIGWAMEHAYELWRAETRPENTLAVLPPSYREPPTDQWQISELTAIASDVQVLEWQGRDPIDVTHPEAAAEIAAARQGRREPGVNVLRLIVFATRARRSGRYVISSREIVAAAVSEHALGRYLQRSGNGTPAEGMLEASLAEFWCNNVSFVGAQAPIVIPTRQGAYFGVLTTACIKSVQSIETVPPVSVVPALRTWLHDDQMNGELFDGVRALRAFPAKNEEAFNAMLALARRHRGATWGGVDGQNIGHA